jgi:plasmid maintenance system antidote protein VapI
MGRIGKNFVLLEAITIRYGSQRKFAEVLGRHESHVSRVITGRENLTDDDQKDWAKLLGKERKELFK